MFATGHIGATLITVTGIDRCLIPLRVATAPDVGAGYGFTTVLAAMAFRFRGVVRVLWAAALVAVLGATT
ncbi:hypothetical protein FB390_3357 [Nocardia bhagyanarayanae]|uniref:Uncharacterized protein n=1 Tax=Nocardia bhagyanarayanae TaxID=1215925 RepID=A0A543FCT9_9NOCA|nr:hypothetical protein [Nocardia bhagyanarayanae]TQM31693.1 hypothetical protein FB390_3357 [Nocardia bhagyanarayanae]